MSAYGAIQRPSLAAPLDATIWHVVPKSTASESPSDTPRFITIHHLTLAAADTHLGLIPVLHKEFADEVARGTTYPQETPADAPLRRDAFDAYFFSADVFVGIVSAGVGPELGPRADETDVSVADQRAIEGVQVQHVDVSIEDARAGRPWEDCVAGFYYVLSTASRPS